MRRCGANIRRLGVRAVAAGLTAAVAATAAAPVAGAASARELLAALAGVEAVYGCMVQNMTQFGTGLPPIRRGDFLERATEQFSDDGRTFEALARAVARSEQRTLMRVVEP